MKPQYRRLQIGVLVGKKSVIYSHIVGELSKVPYAEPTWLADGYHSPYYTEVACFLLLSSSSKYWVPFSRTIESFRRLFVSFLTKLFFQTHWYVKSMCHKLELLEVNWYYLFTGTRGRWKASQQGRYRGNGVSSIYLHSVNVYISISRKVNLHAMRMGPGIHLKGLFILQPETLLCYNFCLVQDGSWWAVSSNLRRWV